MSQLRLPPRGRLTPTGPVDAIERYHSLGFGWVLRRRLRWVLDRLEGAGRQRVLEIGYGSGILMYSLRGMADELVGLDIHENAGMVTRQLARDGITARLTQGDGAVLPFRDGAFDAVIIVSALEFVPDPEACLREAMRVTRPEGRVIAVTPRILRWADRIYQVLVGFDPETEWKGGRVRVQRALSALGGVVRRETRPRFFPRFIAPYELVTLPGRTPVALPEHAGPTPASATSKR